MHVVTVKPETVIPELGGNNAIVVTPQADLELAPRAIAFKLVSCTNPNPRLA